MELALEDAEKPPMTNKQTSGTQRRPKCEVPTPVWFLNEGGRKEANENESPKISEKENGIYFVGVGFHASLLNKVILF